MLSAALAGITARIICHPLDTIKTVNFTGFAGQKGELSRPTNFVGAAKLIWRAEGVKGFYRGLGVTAAGAAPGVALYLSVYDSCSSTWTEYGKASASTVDGGQPWTLQWLAQRTPSSLTAFCSGFAAEAISCAVWVPIDVSKERLQSQPPGLPGRYRGSCDALRRIYANEGFGGWYKGYWSTLCSFGPFSAVYFVSYEAITRQLRLFTEFEGAHSSREASTADARTSFIIAMVAGAGGNIIASLCTNPLELMKTRLQVQRAVLAGLHPSGSSMYGYEYRGMLQGLLSVVQQEGVRALWRGVDSRIAFTAPNAALTMAFYGYLKDHM